MRFRRRTQSAILEIFTARAMDIEATIRGVGGFGKRGTWPSFGHGENARGPAEQRPEVGAAVSGRVDDLRHRASEFS